MQGRETYLGIECGASTTTTILSDKNLTFLKQEISGPANLRLLDDEHLQRHFKHIGAVFPCPSAIGVGMAGVRNEKDTNRIRKVLSSIWPGVPFWIGNDLQVAMEAAIMSSRSKTDIARIIVISGTGSCIYGRTTNGKIIKVGGWGHMLGDRGSGYDIAIRALRLCILEQDRTGYWPRLGQIIIRVLQMSEPDELIDWISKASKDKIAALAEDVMKAWNQRDPLARRVIMKVADILVNDIVTCATRMRVIRKNRTEVYLNGGVLKKNEKFTRLIKKKLSKALPNFVVLILCVEGAWGAVNMARKCPGIGTTGNKISIKEIPRPLPKSTNLSPTEMRNPNSMKLDQLSTIACVNLMLEEESTVTEALLKVKNKITKAIDLISECLKVGGRMVYVGSGTSGRLGVLDASECPPTFHTDPDMVQGIIAGGQKALWTSIEGAEDSFDRGYNSILHRGIRNNDVIVGIATCGKTPFVWGAVKAGLDINARTIFLCFNPNLRIPRAIKPHIFIATDLGPEVLTGSTRLKAGTATKLVLNMFSTLSMVRLGRVVSNLMVDLNPANDKLKQRASRIVICLTGCSKDAANEALITYNWNVKKCIEILGKKKK